MEIEAYRERLRRGLHKLFIDKSGPPKLDSSWIEDVVQALTVEMIEHAPDRIKDYKGLSEAKCHCATRIDALQQGKLLIEWADEMLTKQMAVAGAVLLLEGDSDDEAFPEALDVA